MNAVRRSVFVGAVAAAGLFLPALAGAQERWLADLKVTMTATEDPAAGIIKHVIRVKNQFDDSARDVGITHIPVTGMAILSLSSTSAACAPISYGVIPVWVVHCTLPTLNVGETETIVVVTRNTTTWGGLKVTTAQAMGTSPDRNGADNVFEIVFP